MILRSIDCGRESASGRRWRAYLADDPRDGDPPKLAVFCPSCAENEFGGVGEVGDSSSETTTD